MVYIDSSNMHNVSGPADFSQYKTRFAQQCVEHTHSKGPSSVCHNVLLDEDPTTKCI